MQVTTANFSQARQLITSKILPQTKYIAYDLQFAGVKYQNFARDHINLLPNEKYLKLKYIAQNFQILQLGLTFVTFQGGLKAYPFNFYLFPRNPASYDVELKMQLGCVKFNTLHGMDWNKWINQGVNYIKISQIEAKQGSMKQKSSQTMMQYWSQDWKYAGQKFLSKLSDLDKLNVGAKLTYSNDKLPTAQKALVNLFNTYIRQRQLCLSLVQKQTDFIITKVTPEERKKNVQKVMEQSCGFALLFKQIWNKKTSFIGHNCLLDILYIYHHLVAKLPQDYFQFKQSLKQSGNHFFDTKYIAQKQKHLSQGGTRLEDIYKTITQLCSKKQKATTMTLNFPFDRYSLQKQVLHQAGFDSYLTAWVYQQCMKFYDKLDYQCRDKLNINNSFFFMNLTDLEDQVNPYYAQNILRFNILMNDKDDVRSRRIQFVKWLRKNLQEFQGCFTLYEGYRQVFLQTRSRRNQLVQAIMQIKRQDQRQKKPSFDVNTFGSYFVWQKERVTRQYHRQKPAYNKPYEKKSMKQESSSESNQNHARNMHRGNRPK